MFDPCAIGLSLFLPAGQQLLLGLVRHSILKQGGRSDNAKPDNASLERLNVDGDVL